MQNQTNKLLAILKEKNIQILVENNELDIKAPKGVITPEILEEIKLNKANLISYLNDTSDVINDFPLSSSQHRLWFLQQMQSVRSSYNVSSIFEIEGDLAIDFLKKSFQDLIERHEILRTNFVEDSIGNPVQKILSKTNAQINFSDLSQQYDEKIIKEIVFKECSYHFDLTNDLLIRFTLIKTSNQRYTCLIVAHHIICDDWSLDVIKRDLFAFYKANLFNQSVSLPKLKIQFKEFALQEQRELGSSKFKAQEDYWLDQFQEEFKPLDLTKAKRPAVFSSQGDKISIPLDSFVVDKFKLICQNTGVTNFIGMQSLLCVILHKYSHSNDITVGVPITTRNQEDLKDQVGFYVNTIPLRIKFSPEITFIELLKEVKSKLVLGYQNAGYPLDKLVTKLGLERNLSRNPLFDSIITVQERSLVGNDDGLKIVNSNIELPISSKFDLEFNFVIDGERSELNLLYNKDIYSTEFISNFSAHISNLLSNLVEDPNCSIYKCDYLSKEDKSAVIELFNNKQLHFDSNETLISSFEKIVLNYPKAIAIQQDESFSYEELDKKATLLSNFLLEKYRIKTQECIGVSLERGPELVIALLAILKLRAIYVPLDLDYPQERINYIINDTNIKCVINKDFFETNPVYSIDTISQGKTESSPEDIVYIIYTSGTTGNPKGIMMQSKNMINLFEHQKTEIIKNGKCSFLSNTSFDVSFQEIFSTLLTSGTLYPVSDIVKKDVVQLSDFLKANAIETLFLPTAYFKILIESNYFIDNISSDLKNIVVAGEKLVLNETILSKLRNSDLRVHNHYGPAETHVVTTLIIDKDYSSDLVPSIGKPISNTQIYILDDFMNPVGIGIEGKIFIGGKNVSKGYWNKEDLTNQKFISNPYSEGKLYDTGDLGYWLSDGNIQYIGRNDQQIKIRGFRVELEEIESILNNLVNDFNQVLVATYESETETQLVAYYTASKEVNVLDIKKVLSSKIPNYMIPSFFMKLETIPLTPNGKIDKKALPAPKIETHREKEIELSRTETEQKLVEVWQEILGFSDVGIHDNFFELGGHSLHITKMIYRINEIFAIKITIEEVFNLQNIQALGKLIDQEVLLKQAMNKKATDKLEEIWEI